MCNDMKALQDMSFYLDINQIVFLLSEENTFSKGGCLIRDAIA